MTRLWVVGLCAMCGCGRVAFDARHDSGTPVTDGAADAPRDVAADAALPMAGLVALYSFETGLGDSVAGHDGACGVGLCPIGTTGRVGAQAMLFDGVDDCVDVTDDGTFQLPQITVALWARQDMAGNLSQISKKVGGGSVNSWQLETSPLDMTPQTLSFTTYDGAGVNLYAESAQNSVIVGTWQHLAGTYDGTTKRVYLDGAEVRTMTQTAAMPYDANPVKIGCDDNSPNALFFKGAIDDIRIYDRPLSASEIATLAAQ